MKYAVMAFLLCLLATAAFAQSAQWRQDVLCLPLRYAVAALGGATAWDGATVTATLTLSDRTMQVRPHQDPEVLVNGQPLDQVRGSYSDEGMLYVPVAVFTDGLGARVRVDPTTRVVDLFDADGARRLRLYAAINLWKESRHVAAFRRAVIAGQDTQVARMVRADPRLIDLDGIALAAGTGRLATVLLLLRMSAELHGTTQRHVYSDLEQYRPLAAAVSHGQRDIAALLLRDDASPNATGGSGTPLETAASVGDARMTAFLLAHGAQATLGIPLFHVGNHVDVARLLIAHGADINLTITFGHYADTPLCNAALDNHLEVARLLLDAGARVNAGDPPPLYRAVNYSNVRMIKLLLARGADPNRGWTYTGCPPLHVAETEDIATLLLKAGANINVCDNGGKTTLGHAWPNDTAWIAWLRARGAKYAGELAQ